MSLEESIKVRVEKIRLLMNNVQQTSAMYEAASIIESVIFDTVGSHPLSSDLKTVGNPARLTGACRAFLVIYDQGSFKSPRLSIAHEIEGSILDIADAQAKAADKNSDPSQKQTQLAIAAFLSGAALEDAMRRLCDSNQLQYDTQNTSISKLQSALYQPSKQIEIISTSENKQITAWGDVRNKADHGKFGEIGQTDVVMMLMGVRAFIDKHLP